MPSDDRIRQVKTTRERYGKDHYAEIGAKGAANSPTKFNSQTATEAAKRRWEAYREKRKGKEGNATAKI